MAKKSIAVPAKATSGPATIPGSPLVSALMFNSKGEFVVPEAKPGTPASATGAPAMELNCPIRRVSNAENVSPGCRRKGRVKSAAKPGTVGSIGAYPGREPEKFKGKSGTRERKNRPWSSVTLEYML